MVGFDIIARLQDYCTDNGILFFVGDNFMKNYELIAATALPDQLIMCCDPFLMQPKNVRGGRYSSVDFSSVVILGRKSESAGTISSLDETYRDKWVRRLGELCELMYSHMVNFSCENELECSLDIRADLINFLNTNIDFVRSNVRFTN
jgi:hypothetical protein